MKKYFAQLRPMERRLVVGVAVVLLLVLNAVFVWPHFSDWGDLRDRLDDAQRKLETLPDGHGADSGAVRRR